MHTEKSINFKLTKQQFEKVDKGRLSEKNIKMLYDLLVKGEKASEIARRNNVSSQLVSIHKQSFLKKYNPNLGTDCAKVVVFLPKDQVEKFQKVVEKFISENN